MNDLISRKHFDERIRTAAGMVWDELSEDYKGAVCAILEMLRTEPSVTPKPKTGPCKNCKYFEYNSVAKIDGVPLIVAHEICNKWGDGCKTKEDGYCFLFEPQESEVNNERD